MSTTGVTTRDMEGAHIQHVGGFGEAFDTPALRQQKLGQNGEKSPGCCRSTTASHGRRRPPVSQSDYLVKRSTTIADILDTYEDHGLNVERSETGGVHLTAAGNTTKSHAESALNIRQLIGDSIVLLGADLSFSSSECSEVSCFSSIGIEEGLIEPVTVCPEDASPSIARRQVVDPKDGKVWSVKRIGNGEVVSTGETNDEVEVWKMNNDQFVFAFGDTTTPYYVRLPASGSGKLVLTTEGVDPAFITDPASDPRVMKLVPHEATGERRLIPASDPNLRILIVKGFVEAQAAEDSEYMQWEIRQK